MHKLKGQPLLIQQVNDDNLQKLSVHHFSNLQNVLILFHV